MTWSICVISCEHATCSIPVQWSRYFADTPMLRSHLGWDPGAAGVARAFAQHLNAPLHLATASRLLADCNRSTQHPHVLGAPLRALPRWQRTAILDTWHSPYQTAIRQSVADALLHTTRVLHLSCHSFTPVLDGRTRNADVGLLYDPANEGEASFAIGWQATLLKHGLRVRRNYPYRGTSDGLTRMLRRVFGSAYLGIELELNQALLQGETFPPDVVASLLESLPKAGLPQRLPRGKL